MGLGDLTPSKESSSGGSSSSSTVSRQTLSGVEPSDFPVHVAKTPYLLIKEIDGEYEVLRYPETPEVDVRYDWYSDSQLEHLGYLREHEGWTRWFWTREEYSRVKRRVKEKLGFDLKELLRDDPEGALDAIRLAANERIAQKVEPTERCAICSTKLHVIYDDWEMVNRRRVCQNHTVKDLAEADLL